MISKRVIYFLSVGVITFIIIVAMNNMLELELIPSEVFSEKIIYFSSVKESNANIKEIFAAMADIEKYPEIVPETFVAVTIIEKTDDMVLAKNNVHEKTITITMTTKHTFVENKSQKVEVLDGLVRNSFLDLIFEDIGNKTRVSISGEVHLHGALTLIAPVVENEIQRKIDSIFLDFDRYVQD